MKKEDFFKFYDGIIEKNINDLLDKYGNYNQAANKKRPVVRVRKGAKRKILTRYTDKRNIILKYYMHKTVTALDSHKVAACLMYAIIKSKPIKINKFISNLPPEIILANEYVAVCVALNVVDMYRRHKGDTNFQTVIPLTYFDAEGEKKSEFIPNLCKALSYVKSSKYFDVFAYADILFLLEKYTDVTEPKNS